MNIRKLTRITSLLLVVMMVVSLLPSPSVFAAGNTIFVTPTPGSLQVGQSITIQVKGNIATGTTFGADTVSGSLQFPSNRLKVTSVSTAGATFNWQVSATPTASAVNFDERTISFSPINNSSVHIMSVTFQAIAAGSANLSFSSTTRYSYSNFGTNYPTTLTGGTYTINSPPPTSCPAGQVGTPPNCTTPPPAQCPAGQVGTPPNCTTPAPAKCPSGQTGTPPNCKTPTPAPSGGSNSKPTTPPPATPVAETPAEPIPAPQENGLSISDAVTTREYKTASLSWKTSSPAKNTVIYGTSLSKLDKTAEVTKEPDESYTAKFTELSPGKRYYFTINSESEKDASKTSTYSGVFTTKGFPVSVTITEGGAATSGAKLKISEQTYSTDKSGKITFELASGSYSVEVTTSKSSKKFTLAVAEKTIPDGKAPDTQAFTFDVPVETTSDSGGLSPIALLGIGVGAVALLGLFGGLFLAWRRRKAQGAAAAASAASDGDYSWTAQQPLPAFPQDQQPLANYQDPTPSPMDMPYVAPPDTLPPQEIMPPDQAVAMAIQDLPPIPEELPAMGPTDTPTEIAQSEIGTPEEIAAPYEDTPQAPLADEQPYTQESVQESQGELAQTPIESAPYTEPVMETTSFEQTTPYDEGVEASTPDAAEEEVSTDEPGLTDAPPTTESGKGELQIDHHSVDGSSDTPMDNSEPTASTPR